MDPADAEDPCVVVVVVVFVVLREVPINCLDPTSSVCWRLLDSRDVQAIAFASFVFAVFAFERLLLPGIVFPPAIRYRPLIVNKEDT